MLGSRLLSKRECQFCFLCFDICLLKTHKKATICSRRSVFLCGVLNTILLANIFQSAFRAFHIFSIMDRFITTTDSSSVYSSSNNNKHSAPPKALMSHGKRKALCAKTNENEDTNPFLKEKHKVK